MINGNKAQSDCQSDSASLAAQSTFLENSESTPRNLSRRKIKKFLFMFHRDRFLGVDSEFADPFLCLAPYWFRIGSANAIAATCQIPRFFEKNAKNRQKNLQNPPNIEPKSLKIRQQIEKKTKKCYAAPRRTKN